MHFLRIKAKYCVEHVAGEGFFLLSEKNHFVLEGAYLDHVVPLLLRGHLTADQIVASVQPHLAPEQAREALSILARAGHLEEVDPAVPPESSAFWNELGLTHHEAYVALATRPFAWSTHGSVDPHPFLHVATSFGARTSGSGMVHVALTDDYLRPGLAELNRQCIANRTPLLLFKPIGVCPWFGPLIVPGHTACWRCLEHRLRGNREVEAFIERRTGLVQPFSLPRARVPVLEQQLHVMAATQLVRLLVTGDCPELRSQLVAADLLDFKFEPHTVTRRPQCADCGDVRLASSAGLPIEIRAQSARGDSTSGLRRESPDETFARYRHHVSPITGIVREITPSIWHGEGPLRVYMAGHNFALKNDQLYFLKDGLRSSSSGKGHTDAQARTSALCEALERYSGVSRGDEPRVRASFRELGEDALDPRTCMLFSEKQYREREAWLARGSRFQVVPCPFDEHRAIDWSPVWSLTKSAIRYLPTSYLYYNVATPDNEFMCWADSNGAAAGGSLEEAMLQGLLELVERDAVALWWYNRILRPAVDLAAFDPYLVEVQDFYARHDREYWVLDLTTDTRIPTFVAITRRRRGPSEDIMMGFGAHVDARSAVLRAVTEMNQFIPAVLTVAPDGRAIYGISDHEAISWWQTATLENQPYLAPAGTARKPTDYEASAPHNIATALRGTIDTLQGLGHEVLILNQTRADVGLPVCKMIVPGMRHFWARFAPGRLFDVPARLGWLPEPLTEDRLNPIPMFL